MRGSDVIEFAADWLPNRWRQLIGPVIIGVLVLTGTLDDVFLWFVQDKAASITEDLLAPTINQLQHTGAATTHP